MEDVKKNPSEITFTPELPIGTECYMMVNNKPKLGLIASIRVTISSCTERNRGWFDQLFSRYRNKPQTHKDVWDHYITYQMKLEDGNLYDVEKKNGKWFVLDRRLYFSMTELKENVIG